MKAITQDGIKITKKYVNEETIVYKDREETKSEKKAKTNEDRELEQLMEGAMDSIFEDVMDDIGNPKEVK